MRYPGSKAQRPSAPACPHCKGNTDRIPRSTLDFMVSVVVPVRRYRCLSIGCNWEGSLRKPQGASSRDGRGDHYAGRRPFL